MPCDRRRRQDRAGIIDVAEPSRAAAGRDWPPRSRFVQVLRLIDVRNQIHYILGRNGISTATYRWLTSIRRGYPSFLADALASSVNAVAGCPMKRAQKGDDMKDMNEETSGNGDAESDEGWYRDFLGISTGGLRQSVAWKLDDYGDNGALTDEQVDGLAARFSLTRNQLRELSWMLGDALGNLPTVHLIRRSKAVAEAKAEIEAARKDLAVAEGKIRSANARLAALHVNAYADLDLQSDFEATGQSWRQAHGDPHRGTGAGRAYAGLDARRRTTLCAGRGEVQPAWRPRHHRRRRNRTRVDTREVAHR